ncbi:hypothetical protein [Paenibacillus macquariensis]|uniref:TolB protein n=1 Tax=Paenibacillus macquariensis TaxID=948756 RepID=A0ABY1K334_9BACL|nr:hypothetical protein [Paenibacillus macquariensis]MEC0090245.1 WD40 repeat domain-containing protein [Paenibacillus macquariensis]OAB39607.1 hypothetical protein PMSM_00315 [Paenibacillus macquariensis subsp. macquariensis]SIR18058.1 hypothetical protein SAMN05421578_10871 [Paenibacillus macquariensis]
MKRINRRNSVKLLSVITLLVTLIACQSSHERVTTVTPSNNQTVADAQVSSGNKSGGSDRKLTVVAGSAQKDNQELAVERIHRLEGSNIEAWLSDNEVRINTTKLLKAGTNTEEPKYSYTTSIVDLSTEEQRDVMDHQTSLKIVKETISPDGKFSFVQKWLDKYTADNFIKELSTGKSIAVKGDNYMELGGWLNKDTYILAAGSMEGRGDIRQIATDGTSTNLEIEDEDVNEIFNRFTVSDGRIYYTDSKNNLKGLEAGEKQPSVLVKGVWDFEISPDSKHIAVTTVSAPGKLGTELLIYDSAGNMKGSEIAKGELMSYLAWSPDSSRLAFDVYTTDKNGMNGVYIFDSSSGKVSPMGSSYSPVGMSYNPQYPLTWSPSGKRLGITIEDKKSIIVTQVIDFK